jgi:tetratricopeptide (TPR) repeat protein
LRALRAEVGEPSYGDLEKASAGLANTLAKQTVSDLLNGNSRPRWKTVETFVLACERYARQKRIRRPDGTFDREWWRAEFDRARQGDQLIDGPLREPYRSPETAETPVRLLRAEYAVVPFQSRDELTVLLDWCRQVATGSRTGIAVVHGVGGSGKTRLALELAHRLRGEGWYAGVLPRDIDPAPLATATMPVAVVVDYADGRVADTVALLRTLRARSGPPPVVVLTARSVHGQWLTDIVGSLDDDRHAYGCEEIRLPDEHPRSSDIYRRTVATLRRGDGVPSPVPSPPADVRWTTLDLVLLGWIAASGATALPVDRDRLYNEVLRHEENYWCTVYSRFGAGAEPERALLRKVAAVASLVTPEESRIDDVLSVVRDLRDDPQERRAVRRTLLTCLCPEAGEGLAVRPDPVGEHLLLREFEQDRALLIAALAMADDAQAETALMALDSAGQLDPDAATALIVAIGEAVPGRWWTNLVVAGRRTGSAEAALERLADRPDTPLPLDELSRLLPWSDLALFDLGLIVDRRRLEKARAAGEPPAVIAGLFEDVSRRADRAGDVALSLSAVTEAVNHYRVLVTTDRAAYLPSLARSLTNLAVARSIPGEYASALTACRESIELCRELAATGTGHVPELAQSLSNLGRLLTEDGQHEQALVACGEAVDLSRGLVAWDTTAAPRHVRSLHALSDVLSNLGRLEQALEADREAVAVSRDLAATDTRHVLDVARSLNNLGATLISAARYEEALAACQEAAELFGASGEDGLGTLAYLVRALNNVSMVLSQLQRHEQAITVSEKSVAVSRKLVDTNPVHELLHTQSLTNLSSAHAGTGQWVRAHEITTAVVAILDRLAQRSSACESPLARSLGNLGAAEVRLGRLEEALATYQRATTIYGKLVSTNSAHRADYGRCLGGLSGTLRALRHHRQALETSERAVEVLRELAADHPVHLSDFAEALGAFSSCLANVGDHEKALSSGQEALDISRALAGSDEARLPVLARAISDLGLAFSQWGRHSEAVPLVAEAVDLYQRLAAADSEYLADLATAKSNLGTILSHLGRHEEALRPGEEAAHLHGVLAASGSTRHRAEHAVSMLNLGRVLWNLGRDNEALPSSRWAVERHRVLAEENFAAHGPDLALALNNLGLVLWRLRQHEQALPLSVEAVALYRKFAEGDHHHLAGLAMALTNLAVRYRELGRHEEAVAPSQEAVEIRRGLVSRNPGPFLPGLALALHNLGMMLAKVGGVEDGVVATEESLRLYRGLADADSAAYSPFLARTLDALAAKLFAADRLDEALSASREAVGLYTDLAARNPVGTLFELANALRNHSDRCPRHGATDLWRAAIAAMTSGCARAVLRGGWSDWYAGRGLLGQAADELRRAMSDLEGGPAVGGDDPAIAVILTMSARQAIRAVVQNFDIGVDALPSWATAPVPEAHDTLLRSLAEAQDWPTTRGILTAERELVTAADLRTTLDVLLALHLDNAAVRRVGRLLETIAQLGLDEFVQQQDEFDRSLTTVGEWLRIVPWAGSMRFLDEHRDALTGDVCRRILAGVEHDVARQRLAALTLAETLPLEAVLSIATDVDVAEEAALAAVDGGRVEQMTAILNIAPDLARRTTTWLLVAAVVLVSNDQPGPAVELARQIAENGTPILRRAHVIRLRKFSGHNPALEQIQDLIAVIRGASP